MALIPGYTFGKTIHTTFGQIKEGKHVGTGEKVAIKEIELFGDNMISSLDKYRSNVRREVFLATHLHHPSILTCYDGTVGTDKAYIVMEWMDGGSLLEYIGKRVLSEKKARKLFRQLIDGLDYLHSHLVVHRDIKPQNLLLDERHRNLKIADFGWSRYVPADEVISTYCGTFDYMAPEVQLRKSYRGPESDIWSAGITLFECLIGKLGHGNFRGRIPVKTDKIGDDAFDLVSRMAAYEPKDRLTIGAIRNHKWFKGREKIPAVFDEGYGIDAEILHETVTETKCERDELIESLLKRKNSLASF